MNNKMKSLMYVIITLYMLNYVVSTTCMDINPTEISDCTNHKITKEELESYASEFSDADTCCYYKSVISGDVKVDCMPVKKSNESNVKEKEKNDLIADAKKKEYQIVLSHLYAILILILILILIFVLLCLILVLKIILFGYLSV